MTAVGVTRRDHVLVLAALILLASLAWAYTIYLGIKHSAMPTDGGMAMPMMMAWSITDFLFMFIMWAVMMFAMRSRRRSQSMSAYR